MALEYQVLPSGQVALDHRLLVLDPDERAYSVGELVQVESGDSGRTRGLSQQRSEYFDRRALPSAVRPQESEELSFLYVERDAVYRFGAISVDLNEVLDCDYVWHDRSRARERRGFISISNTISLSITLHCSISMTLIHPACLNDTSCRLLERRNGCTPKRCLGASFGSTSCRCCRSNGRPVTR